MTRRRCGWCGRFVSSTAQPMPGLNYWGTPVVQLLCPADAAAWRDLAAANVIWRRPGEWAR